MVPLLKFQYKLTCKINVHALNFPLEQAQQFFYGKGIEQVRGTSTLCVENLSLYWNLADEGNMAIDRSSRLHPRCTCEQERVGLSNAFLHNSAARAKHTRTHVGPLLRCDWSIHNGAELSGPVYCCVCHGLIRASSSTNVELLQALQSCGLLPSGWYIYTMYLVSYTCW